MTQSLPMPLPDSLTGDDLPPALQTLLKDTVMNFARSKVQGESELNNGGGQTKQAAAGHYDDALSQLAGLLSHLPPDQAAEINAQLELVRVKMQNELGVESKAPPRDVKASLPLESSARGREFTLQSGEENPELAADEGLAELYLATNNGGSLGETLATGRSVFVLRENVSTSGNHLAFHFEARKVVSFAVSALVTFVDDTTDVIFPDGAELDGIALDRVAPRTESFAPGAASSDEAVAYHKTRAAASVALGNIPMACGELVEALRWLDLVDGRNSERAAVLVTLGRLHLKAEWLEAAVSALNESERIFPTVGATLLKARVSIARGAIEDARKGVEKAKAAGGTAEEIEAVLREIADREAADQKLYLDVARLAQEARSKKQEAAQNSQSSR